MTLNAGRRRSARVEALCAGGPSCERELLVRRAGAICAERSWLHCAERRTFVRTESSCVGTVDDAA